MAKLFANSRDPHQTLCSVASDLSLHCLPITLLQVSRLQWVKGGYKKITLMGLDTLGRCSTISAKGGNFVTSCLHYCSPSFFWKWVNPKRKEFAPCRSKFFPSRVDTFSGGRQKQFGHSSLPWKYSKISLLRPSFGLSKSGHVEGGQFT